ncbi:adenosylcobalamin-dependent ribonucleoside-diphosphate reductase [Chondrinema litorale]|uniref:adenosylcobalamin-dependent ribonucleoside-diphosphate reductase n=1 Tax=Chondrinema litorale TaxID=2994555 RepID=UPI0025436D81|nr:adenosylcobalamin-dependent ribonucleoside-diphosphate reductase [Chondrinema litorale]UZR98680.1 adenosylcobalamin-dependent ribonucleoside-diphosphate reductase [Chondrinema litorale]
MIQDKSITQKKVESNGQSSYSYQEVLEASKAYFSGDELAATTWMHKYSMKDKEGKFLEKSPEDMHRRMAEQFARIEGKYAKSITKEKSGKLSTYGKKRKALSFEKVYELFKEFKYVIPQGSVMAALGNTHMMASLSNCVVLPSPYDSYGGICQTDEQLAQLFKRRCGVGIDISTLRPANMNVANAAGTTSGAVSFMERFSNTTREVAQNGRRGALMITIDVAHPDVEDFVKIKQDLTKVTGANVSVRLSDEFMNAVSEGTEFKLRFPIDAKDPEISKMVDARELWKVIISSAHNTAEPGLIFWDRQHWYSTSSVYPEFKNISTNPCSEIAMQGGDSCRLIALNLYNFVDNPFTPEASFDYEKFFEITYEAQRLMDDLVDLELESIERIMAKIESDPEPDSIKKNELETWKLLYETGKKGRRTGLGFTAMGDAMAALNLKFDSDEAVEAIDKIMRVKCEAEFESSIDMAVERDAFVGFNSEIENQSEFVQMLEKEFPVVYKRMMEYGRRNISISTVAPTGTLSMLAQTTSGIEPAFMLSYKRRRKVNASQKETKGTFKDDMGDMWEEFDVYHAKFKTWMEISGKSDVEESPYVGSTAQEIDWLKRVEIQAVVQKYVTHSISSTINLPQDISVEKVGEIYMESWKHGLKGITVYRDGSRSGVLVSNDKKDDGANEIVETVAPKRPSKLEARVIRFYNEQEAWLAVVGLLNGRPYEIFTGQAEEAFALPEYVDKGWVIKGETENGRSRYDFQYHDRQGYRVTIEGLSRSFNKEFWNYAKLISGILRHGMPLPYVVDLVSNLNFDKDYINTWKNGVARSLKSLIPDGTVAVDRECPNCSDPDGLIYEEGCLKCKSCGYSKCN